MAEHNCLHMTDFGHYFWQYGMAYGHVENEIDI